MEQERIIQAGSAQRTAAFSALMNKVYLWMTMGLAMTALAAGYVSQNMAWVQNIVTGFTPWILMIAEIGLVFYLGSRIMSMSFAKAGILFALYSLLNGVTLSVIFVAYTMSDITSAFLATAGTFGAMSIVGFFIKRDLSAMGRFLYMALIGLIIATVVNIFVASSSLSWIINYVGVLLFCGLTAYDTQKIKMMFLQYGDEVNEGTMKLALLGSLNLYLDFINLFLYLLRIFASDRE